MVTEATVTAAATAPPAIVDMAAEATAAGPSNLPTGVASSVVLTAESDVATVLDVREAQALKDGNSVVHRVFVVPLVA